MSGLEHTHRKPSHPELEAEGWFWMWDRGEDGSLLIWMHPPSGRVVSVECFRPSPNHEVWVTGEHSPRSNEGWWVICRSHDDLGNPTDGTILAPFELFNDALRRARAIRRAILAEHPDPVTSSQLSLFADEVVP